MGSKTHKSDAPKQVTLGIITISTTRTLAEDKSGAWMNKRARKEGHTVLFHRIVPDESGAIREMVVESIREYAPQVILLTGGTGISPQDVTIETLQPLFQKELTAFGALFAQLSFEQIDAAAFLSRATAGIIDNTAVFCLPGSLNACKLACKFLIFPEVGHLVGHMLKK